MEARTDTSDGSYIHLVGPATIHVIDGQIHLFLLDKNRKPIEPDPTKQIILGSQVSFVNMHMVTEFSSDLLSKHSSIVEASAFPFVEFRMITDLTNAERSNFADCMTSTDPPCNNTVIG